MKAENESINAGSSRGTGIKGTILVAGSKIFPLCNGPGYLSRPVRASGLIIKEMKPFFRK
jgi:hypothetical protein